VALDVPELQDNPKVWWDTDLIQKLVAEHVKKWSIDAVSIVMHLVSSVQELMLCRSSPLTTAAYRGTSIIEQ
jgi:hypothetical protein